MKLQINYPKEGWIHAGEITFGTQKDVTIEYDIEYASNFMGLKDFRALSVNLPVSIEYPAYHGNFPGFMLDLIPQGKSLKKVLARYNIQSENSFEEILGKVPLASPGNIRIFEPWEDIEKERPSYNQKGFELGEIIDRSDGFIDYMLESSAPIGGTTGAQGGAPKFLLRRDYQGKFHADGFLDDSLTDECFMIKFPIDAADNSIDINKTEKIFYDYLLRSPLKTHKPIEIYDGILFCKRFDRVRHQSDNLLHYSGLETVYSLMGRNTFASSLYHEDVIRSLADHLTNPSKDLIEYICRDIVNKAFCNTDNHGRNTSLIKRTDGKIELSPIYDVAAMQLFKGDHITELTTWREEGRDLSDRVHFTSELIKESPEAIRQKMRWLIPFLESFRLDFSKQEVPEMFRTKIASATSDQLEILREVL